MLSIMLSLHGEELGCGVYLSTCTVVSEQNDTEKRLFQVRGEQTILLVGDKSGNKLPLVQY